MVRGRSRPGGSQATDGGARRVVSIVVSPDALPTVRISTPGRDLVYPAPAQEVAFEARAVTALDLFTVLVSAILVALLLLVLGRTDWGHQVFGRIRPSRWATRGRWASGGWLRRGRPADQAARSSKSLAKQLR